MATFDPSQPFDVVGGPQQQGGQMPTPAPQAQAMPQASQPIPAQRTPNLNAAIQQGQQPAPQQQPVQFDPTKPFEVVSGPQQQPVPQNSLAGAGKAARQGLVNAASGLIGLPGDITNLGARALGYGDDYGKTWGSESAKKGIEKSFGIDEYEPQTRLEKYIRTGAEFLPAAAFPVGDMSIGTKLLSLVAAPAVGSEAAGQLTEGTPYEPYARMAGGIAGGLAGSKIANMVAARNVAAANPMQDAAQLGTGATAVYQGPKLNSVSFTPDAADDLQDVMRAATGSRDASLAGGTHGIINKLDRATVSPDPMSALTGVAPPQRQPVPWQDVHNARILLGEQAGKYADPIDQGAAVAAKKAMDNWLKNVPQSALQSGDVSEIKNFFTANTNYQVMSALNMLSGKEYAAELGAAAANSGANYENKVRQAIRGILVTPARRAQFENLPNGDEVIKAMEDVNRGGKTENLLRFFSNYLGGGGGLGAVATGIGGMLAGAGPAGLLAPVPGMVMKGISNRMTNNKISNLANMIQQGAPANQAALTARNALQQRLQGMNPAQRAIVNAALARNQGLLTQQQSQ